MIADIAFDAPLPAPFSYRIPDEVTVAPGQRVLAPLGRATRVGIVLAVRAGEASGLKALGTVLDPVPVLDAARLELVRWIAAQTLSSPGSTALALVPPPGRATGRRSTAGPGPAGPGAVVTGPVPACHTGRRPDAPGERPTAPVPDVLVGGGREGRLLERLAASGPALVLVADVEAAARWARRLAPVGPVVRLDSGVAETARAAAWASLATGTARLAVGTRSALLAPLPAGGLLVLVDEQEPAHKPPGPPRMHARDVVLERARRERLQAVLTAGVPSVETWWRGTSHRARLVVGPASRTPEVRLTDPRGIARREPLTPPLSRAIRETLAAGRRVFLCVSREASSLGCEECGGVARCDGCAIALAYSPASRTLTCRLCGVSVPPPDLCAGCGGRRLAPFGLGADRVEASVRRRFPGVRVARYSPETGRGRRGETQREAAKAAAVVIGTRGALRLFGRGSLGLAGFIAPDQLLGLPDFRAAERAFGTMWAAAERVRPDGEVILQVRNPEHYAIEAAVKHDLETFYRPELRFRGELGYPPFRRLAVLTVGGDGAAARLEALVAALSVSRRLTVYPPRAAPGGRAWRAVVKGHEDLPALLEAGLADWRAPRRGRAIMEVEVDPVEWLF